MQEEPKSIGYQKGVGSHAHTWVYQFTEKGWEFKRIWTDANEPLNPDDYYELTALPGKLSAYDKKTAVDICIKQLKTGKPKPGTNVLLCHPSYSDDGMCTYAGLYTTHGEMLHKYCENAVELMTTGLCDLLTKNNIPWIIPYSNPHNGIVTPIRKYIPQPLGDNWSLFKRPRDEFSCVSYFYLLTDISYHVSVNASDTKLSDSDRKGNCGDGTCSFCSMCKEKTKKVADAKESESRIYVPKLFVPDFDGDNMFIPIIKDFDDIIYVRTPKPPTAKIAFRITDPIAKDSVENFFVECGTPILRNLYADTYVSRFLITDIIVQLCKPDTKAEFHATDFNGKKERIRFINGTHCINIVTGAEHVIESIYY